MKDFIGIWFRHGALKFETFESFKDAYDSMEFQNGEGQISRVAILWPDLKIGWQNNFYPEKYIHELIEEIKPKLPCSPMK